MLRIILLLLLLDSNSFGLRQTAENQLMRSGCPDNILQAISDNARSAEVKMRAGRIRDYLYQPMERLPEPNPMPLADPE